MGVTDDMAAVARQEAALALPAFDTDVAWKLGCLARELAVTRGQAIVIDIRQFGQPHQQLFYAALPGTTPDNARWVERKVNVVARFHRSSYAMGLKLLLEGVPFTGKYALPDAELCHAWRLLSAAGGRRGRSREPDDLGAASAS